MHNFVDRVASKLIEAGESSSLPELEKLESLAGISNAFRSSFEKPIQTANDVPGGPTNVRFCFVAGCGTEFKRIPQFAQEAVRIAKVEHCIDLEFSLFSLAALDSMISPAAAGSTLLGLLRAG